jgi:phage I-like protein
MSVARSYALAFDTKGGLPTEFRLFVRGWNDSEKGSFLFDEEAARLTIAGYQKWGVDLAIDLEHQMLDAAGGDPTARDARGWCKLQLRPDGSLWAVDVRWTEDGAARLSQKRQRYVSPAFEVDSQTKRITKIVNIALVAIPATHKTPALVAASKGMGMDSKLISAALDALVAGDSEKAAEILKQIIAEAAGCDPDAGTEDAPPPVGDAGADEMTESAAPSPAADAPPAEEPKTAVAATALLSRLTGKATVTESLDEVEVWRASHLALETERQTLAAERATLESSERRRLCVELIQLGAEFPSTVWADPLANPLTLADRWRSVPIAELKATVAGQRTARGGRSRSPSPPRAEGSPESASKTVVVEGKTVALSARELAICAETNCPPETFALLKSRREKGTK